MKILYLDINALYHNPTRNNITLLLKNLGELYIYGLGYQPDITLEKGLPTFYEEHGPFDLIITNEHIIFGSQNANENDKYHKAYQKNYYIQFNVLKIQKVLNEQYQFFKSFTGKKGIFLLESDYYNFEFRKIIQLQNLDSYIIGWGQGMVANTEILEDLQQESFGERANNNWYNFVQGNPKIIQMPHFVNSSEFYFECLDNRKNIINVAGVDYYHRRRTLAVLKQSNYKIHNMKIYTKLYSFMRKLRIRPDGNPILMRLYNVLFRNEIEHSKYVFTCGSGLEWPIRKFFEIPTSGSLLLAKPFYNAGALGFLDGINYIKTDYQDIVEKIDFLESNPAIAQKIAQQGQNMIWNSHSLEARSKQLKKCFDTVLANNFHKSYWKNGEFHVE